jgi:hypothetical protein
LKGTEFEETIGKESLSDDPSLCISENPYGKSEQQ